MFACLASNADRLELRTHWLNEQRAVSTIARLMRCIDAASNLDADKIELNSLLHQYLYVWNTFVVENIFLFHVN